MRKGVLFRFYGFFAFCDLLNGVQEVAILRVFAVLGACFDIILRTVFAIILRASGGTFFGGIRGILFGSVAEKVVKNSPVPVLTIRPAGNYTGGPAYKD